MEVYGRVRTQGQKGALEDLRIKNQEVWRQANSFLMLLIIPVKSKAKVNEVSCPQS